MDVVGVGRERYADEETELSLRAELRKLLRSEMYEVVRPEMGITFLLTHWPLQRFLGPLFFYWK
jgi:hypothetical protein